MCFQQVDGDFSARIPCHRHVFGIAKSAMLSVDDTAAAANATTAANSAAATAAAVSAAVDSTAAATIMTV
eukprot:CAMPEP_0119316198 /NCGR_PEP_ID=MMETSP1333-20130426/38923_1 /TAXON_ID=418940 /ORGANISM="Scyphosphaera apsteinii, Strain RCC1455" /LENGTH=69 /DNA_ID=CAMNT_0007321785 /DNA_START=99 /DNA_END=308 /DNA_ORIENTATION=+